MHNDDDTRPQPLSTAPAGGAAGGARDGELLLRPWRRLAHRLVPLIGDSGFCALHGRAARLVHDRYDWLGNTGAARTFAQLIALLGERYAEVDAVTAESANEALLATFTGLLASLIGEALTLRLLDAATPMNAQEHTR